MMTDEREPLESRDPLDGSIPKQVWNKYRYMTIYASLVSTVLLLLQLRGH